MNDNLERCLYKAGLTAQGCWDELDDYAKQGIEKFADHIVRECAKIAVAIPCPIEEGISRQTQGHTWDMACVATGKAIKEHFGVAE
jgi:hypothetical protein